MLNLREYRNRADRLADHVPWAALVAPGVVLNKDGGFQRTLRFRGPDLESATEAELVSACARANNVLKRFGSGWALHIEAERREALGYPESGFPEAASWLVDEERRASFEAAGAHFESRYHLTLTFLPPADQADSAGRALVERVDAPQGRDWHQALAGFVAETDRALDLFSGFMPEIAALDDAETLAFLHGTISTRRHPVRVPETPMYLDGLLVDTSLIGGLEPMLGSLHLRTLTLLGFPSLSRPGILDALNHQDFGYRWVTRFIALDKTDATKALKVDPETLVLRGRPSRIIRFRRGAIIAIAALGSTAIVGVTRVALKPATFRIVAGAEDQKDIANRAPDDALFGAPKSYGDVPRLGPPLPGDLGRPILRRQEALGGLPPVAPSDQAAQAAEAERQRLLSERKAARESGIMMRLGSTGQAAGAAPSSTATPAAPPGPAAVEATIAVDPARDPGNQQRKADFLDGKDQRGDINPHALAALVSPYTLSAGSIIAASLITGLNSDLPGLVTAQVTENAYDSATGHILLVPQGARLIGSYDSVVAYGQSRALVVWQRIVFPNGSSIRIDNVPATDMSGYAGLSDKVDAHTWQLLKGIGLATLLGVGTELSLGDSESDLVRAIRESAQQGTSRAGDQITAKNLNVQPTIKVRPGWPVRVVVQKDIILAPWPGQEQ